MTVAPFMRGYAYSPAERRRLARSESGPGRRVSRRVRQRRSQLAFTRAGVEELAVLHIRGFRSREMEIDETEAWSVVITVRRPAADIATFAAAVRDIRPVHIVVEVRATP
jgi:hypothetical protein